MEVKTNKMPCLRKKPLTVYNLSSTCFGPLWAITNQLQIMIMNSVKHTILHISTNYLCIYKCKNMKSYVKCWLFYHFIFLSLYLHKWFFDMCCILSLHTSLCNYWSFLLVAQEELKHVWDELWTVGIFPKNSVFCWA